jgi:hypothetical protein
MYRDIIPRSAEIIVHFYHYEGPVRLVDSHSLPALLIGATGHLVRIRSGYVKVDSGVFSLTQTKEIQKKFGEMIRNKELIKEEFGDEDLPSGFFDIKKDLDDIIAEREKISSELE